MYNCPSSTTPDRTDGDPQPNAGNGVTDWSSAKVAITDYSPTLGVSLWARPANGSLSASLQQADVNGLGILAHQDPTNQPRISDVKDGLSNTILYAESAGRPVVYRQGRALPGATTSNRVNAGGWSRPASDFWVDGTVLTGTGAAQVALFGAAAANGKPLKAINATNGEDIGPGTTDPSATGSTGLVPYPTTSTAGAPGAAAASFSLGTSEAYSFHTGGANFAFGDGSVRFISDTIGFADFARLVTRESGETMTYVLE